MNHLNHKTKEESALNEHYNVTPDNPFSLSLSDEVNEHFYNQERLTPSLQRKCVLRTTRGKCAKFSFNFPV